MSYEFPILDEASAKVFSEVRTHKAMPLFEIAAATGIQGAQLRGTVKLLIDQKLVTVTGENPAKTIVRISGVYY